ncbi:hypothetical protein FCX17_23635, partial [Escherichia coli]|nr:hypothetical protein [Escherichia coli]MDN0933656.1 hypothetical protein [Escherichia coli]
MLRLTGCCQHTAPAWHSGTLPKLITPVPPLTRNEHMPEAHRQHATWTPERLLEWAGHIGSETHSYVL